MVTGVKERLKKIKENLQQDNLIPKSKAREFAEFLHECKNNKEIQEYMTLLHETATTDIELNLKKNAELIIQYYFQHERKQLDDKKKLEHKIEKFGKHGKEIWRSATSKDTSTLLFVFLFSGFLTVVLATLFIFGETKFSDLIVVPNTVKVIAFLIWLYISIVLCIPFVYNMKPHLIIYKFGINIRYLRRPFIGKFIPYEVMERMGFFKGKIRIRLLDGQIFDISKTWVNEIRKAKNLINKSYKKLLKSSLGLLQEEDKINFKEALRNG